MLAAMRDIPFYNNRLKDKRIWREIDDYTDSVLYKKVGLVGYGGVGRYVAKMLSNFDVDMKISARRELPEEDKKLFFPEQIYKDKTFIVENYPTNIKYGDMSNNTLEEKLRLLEKWEY